MARSEQALPRPQPPNRTEKGPVGPPGHWRPQTLVSSSNSFRQQKRQSQQASTSEGQELQQQQQQQQQQPMSQQYPPWHDGQQQSYPRRQQNQQGRQGGNQQHRPQQQQQQQQRPHQNQGDCSSNTSRPPNQQVSVLRAPILALRRAQDATGANSAVIRFRNALLTAESNDEPVDGPLLGMAAAQLSRLQLRDAMESLSAFAWPRLPRCGGREVAEMTSAAVKLDCDDHSFFKFAAAYCDEQPNSFKSLRDVSLMATALQKRLPGPSNTTSNHNLTQNPHRVQIDGATAFRGLAVAAKNHLGPGSQVVIRDITEFLYSYSNALHLAFHSAQHSAGAAAGTTNNISNATAANPTDGVALATARDYEDEEAEDMGLSASLMSSSLAMPKRGSRNRLADDPVSATVISMACCAALPKLHFATPQDLAKLSGSVAVAWTMLPSLQVDVLGPLASALAQALCYRIQDFNLQDLSLTASAFTKINRLEDHVADLLATKINECLPKFADKDLSLLLWASSRAGWASTRCLAVALREFKDRSLAQWLPQDLCMTSQALAKIGGPARAHLCLAFEEIFRRQLQGFTCADKAVLLWALAKSKVLHSGLCRQLVRSLAVEDRSKLARDVVSAALWALAVVSSSVDSPISSGLALGKSSSGDPDAAAAVAGAAKAQEPASNGSASWSDKLVEGLCKCYPWEGAPGYEVANAAWAFAHLPESIVGRYWPSLLKAVERVSLDSASVHELCNLLRGAAAAHAAKAENAAKWLAAIAGKVLSRLSDVDDLETLLSDHDRRSLTSTLEHSRACCCGKIEEVARLDALLKDQPCCSVDEDFVRYETEAAIGGSSLSTVPEGRATTPCKSKGKQNLDADDDEDDEDDDAEEVAHHDSVCSCAASTVCCEGQHGEVEPQAAAGKEDSEQAREAELSRSSREETTCHGHSHHEDHHEHGHGGYGPGRHGPDCEECCSQAASHDSSHAHSCRHGDHGHHHGSPQTPARAPDMRVKSPPSRGGGRSSKSTPAPGSPTAAAAAAAAAAGAAEDEEEEDGNSEEQHDLFGEMQPSSRKHGRAHCSLNCCPPLFDGGSGSTAESLLRLNAHCNYSGHCVQLKHTFIHVECTTEADDDCFFCNLKRRPRARSSDNLDLPRTFSPHRVVGGLGSSRGILKVDGEALPTSPTRQRSWQ